MEQVLHSTHSRDDLGLGAVNELRHDMVPPVPSANFFQPVDHVDPIAIRARRHVAVAQRIRRQRILPGKLIKFGPQASKICLDAGQ